MARIPQVLLVFSSQSVTSSGTVTSDTLNLGRLAYAGLHYKLSTATTGTYVSATARIILTADLRESPLAPVDDGANDVSVLTQINSNNRYVQCSIPLAPLGQVQLISATNNTITFDAVYLVLDEAN
jgi:hypothetical protein